MSYILIQVQPISTRLVLQVIFKTVIYSSIMLQMSWFGVLGVALYLIADLEVLPPAERKAAFGVFTHLVDVFLLILERGKRAYMPVSNDSWLAEELAAAYRRK